MNAVLTALHLAQALITWIVSQGIARERIQAILDASAESGEDITSETVQAELDATGAELDETARLIDDEN